MAWLELRLHHPLARELHRGGARHLLDSSSDLYWQPLTEMVLMFLKFHCRACLETQLLP